MASSSLLFATFLISFSTLSSVLALNLQTYIVHVHPTNNIMSNSDEDLENYYRSFLPQTLADVSSQNTDRLVYSYSEVFSGFAARLTEQEVQELSKKQGFVRAFPNKIIPLLTTHTPDFLGLTGNIGLWNPSNLGKGVIVGVLDTGILPNHPSFSDDGMSPPPSKWKGKCELKTGCNNKIIGAVGFNSNATVKVVVDPTDDQGHGTHTASTIGGNFVKNANLFGVANGTAAGMAPHAHLAIYKVCTLNVGCRYADILAGLDTAVKDGVDIVSISIGGRTTEYDRDTIAIGSFRAFQKGITVVCAGGNDGPGKSTVSNEAPWILTVAASTVDRSFRATVKLGDGKEYYGEAIYQPKSLGTDPIPLVYGGDCNTAAKQANLKGKLVVCEAHGDVGYVSSAGAVGVILVNPPSCGYIIMDNFYPLPTSSLSYADGVEIKNYVQSVSTPTASIIYNGTILGTSPAPVIADFSSRGPSVQTPGVLKPDISAPGVNIFAAWHQLVDGNSEIPFNIKSGTSMAAPHVSGIAALLKSVHPDWSPTRIMSAIITSSDIVGRDGESILDEKHNNASFFVSGAGHVNPSKATDPGLVYELETEDYIAYLCGSLGKQRASTIISGNFSCDKTLEDIELNYPTITVPLSSRSTTVNRTVTNVGSANAKYIVDLSDVPKGLTMTVKSDTLQFSKVNEKQAFTVSLTWSEGNTGTGQANLRWVSGDTVVRSAIAFTTPSVLNH